VVWIVAELGRVPADSKIQTLHALGARDQVAHGPKDPEYQGRMSPGPGIPHR